MSLGGKDVQSCFKYIMTKLPVQVFSAIQSYKSRSAIVREQTGWYMGAKRLDGWEKFGRVYTKPFLLLAQYTSRLFQNNKFKLILCISLAQILWYDPSLTGDLKRLWWKETRPFAIAESGHRYLEQKIFRSKHSRCPEAHFLNVLSTSYSRTQHE